MADNTIRTVLEIGGEKAYKKSLQEINSVIKGLDSEVAVLNARYGKNSDSMDALIAKEAQLANRLDVQKKKLELVRTEYERVAKEQGEGSEAARKLQREYNYASAQFERTSRAMEEVGRQLQETNSRMEEAAQQVEEVTEQVDQSESAFEQYQKTLKSTDTALKVLDSEFALLDAQYSKSSGSVTALIGKQKLLTDRFEAQQKKLELVRKEYERVADEQGEMSEAAQELKIEVNNANARLERTKSTLEKVNEQVDQSENRFAQLKGKLDAVGVSAKDFGQVMETCGDKMYKVAALAASGAITAAVGGWMALEDEMANVATIADTSEKSMEELTDEVIAASDAAGVAATQIAQAQYQAISANVATADSAALVEKAAKAAKAGVSDVSTVIDGATSILNAWKISAADSEQVFDKLLKTQQRGKTTIGELAGSIGQVTGLAPQLNMSLDETLAAVGALTQSGVGTSEAFNGLKAVLSGVLKPTAEAAEEAERLGLEFDSAALKSKGFTGFLAEVMDKTGGSEESLAKLFGSVEGLSQVMLLGGSSAGLYADILDDLTNSAGTLDEMFKTRTSSSAERFSMALNRINNAAIRLGQSFAPYIDLAADAVESLADSIAKMDVEEGKSLITTALWIAGAGKTISVAGKLIANIESITKGFKMMGALLSAGGPVIGGVVAAGAAIAAAAAIMESSTKAKISFDIDDSDLENYKIDTHTLKDPITVQAEAELQIQSDLKSVGDEIVKWLSDGVPETPEEQAAMAAKVNEAVGVAFGAIETHYNTKKAELDQQLAAGIITQESYDASMTQLNTQTAAMKGDLTTQAEAVNSYVAQLVAANKTITEEEIEHLNALLKTLGLTSAQVLEATNAQKAAYEWAYKKTSMGIGDESSDRQAAEWIELQASTKRMQVESTITSTQARYAQQGAGLTDKDEIARLQAQEKAEIAQLEKQLAEIELNRQAQYAELIRGVAQREGIDADALAEYLALDKGVNGEQLTAEEMGYGSLIDALARLDELGKQFNGLDMTPFENVVGSLIANSDDTSADTLDAMADSFAALNQAAAENEGIKKLPAKFGEAASNSVSSLTGGLKAGEQSAYNAGFGLGKATEWGFKAAIKMNSPSKVFQDAAHNIAGTLADTLRYDMPKVRAAGDLLADAAVSSRWSITGVNSQVARMQSAARSFNAPSASASSSTVTQTTAPKAAKAGTTIVNNISYTAGAGTRRQARLLSQRLADEQRAALTAEGL